MIAFFFHIATWIITSKYLSYVHEERENSQRRYWTKLLPYGAILGIVFSIVPWFISIMAGLRNFVSGESYAGYMTVFIFSSLFTFSWWVTYLVSLEERLTYYPVHENRDIENARELVSRGIAQKFRNI